MYSEFRDDPLFPAMVKQSTERYLNNTTSPGILGCVDNAFIHDPDLNRSWNWPQKRENASPLLLYSNFDELNGNVTLTHSNLARYLLFMTISRSFGSVMGGGVMDLEAKSHCNAMYCKGLPREQWKVEARQCFETSLAQLQYSVLDIVRGTNDPHFLFTWSAPDNPPNLRDVCHMGKFKSVGWRNVSAWGLIGLLSLSGGISLATVKTENDELWLVVGAQLVNRAFWWGMCLPRKIPWASTSNRIVHFVSPFSERWAGVASQRRWPSSRVFVS